MKKLFLFPRKILVFIIVIYQKTISFDHGFLKFLYPYGYCRFYPTCSEYSKQVIKKYGIIKGFFLTIERLVKCNPWSEPKINLVK
jgi:putative membrane protein insertion efficiency factor